MKNRFTLPPVDHRSSYQQLLVSIENLKDQTADAVYEVDRQAMLSRECSRRCYLNELGTGLEIIAAQLEFHFPDGVAEVDLEEWAKILAVLNSASEWIEGQVLELDLRLGFTELAEQLQFLAHAYCASVPELIVARCEPHRLAGAVAGGPAPQPDPARPGEADPHHRPLLSYAH